jgi:NAD(P)H-flavin reductase/formate hydrogenlyase subunit 6/NADH:ubiquinone oxidoreductase subunit I
VLIRTRRDESGAPISESAGGEAPRTAFLGVRACELAAIAVQDRVFIGGSRVDPRYASRRANTLLIGVSCGDPASTCFCTSMDTGPRVRDGADLVLTELPGRFHVVARTEAGEELARTLPLRPVAAVELEEVDAVEVRAIARIERHVDTQDLPGRLFANLDHPQWEEVARRCLSCGNCALVCPTCFCSDVKEVSDLDNRASERVRTWDTCFTLDHGSIHGAVYRPHTVDRYRQWLTHKFGSWVAQFGTSGCVGCGRCLTWCPVGIDVTEELATIAGGPPAPVPAHQPEPAPIPGDPYLPVNGEVLSVRQELADLFTLTIRSPTVAVGAHGQFHQLGLPGVGEVPVSQSGEGPDHVHTIRAVGAVTDALCALRPGDIVQIRGPYGSTWPLDALRGAPVVVVAGGLGLAPLRTAIRALLADREAYPDVTLLVGARSPEALVYAEELDAWRQAGAQVEVTVDRASPWWTGHVGVVTRLLGPATLRPGVAALVCGPEVMMTFTLAELARRGVPPDRVWVSMERHMKCAIGQCGRCQYGHWLVCRDGAVFRAADLAGVLGHVGF